MIVSAISFSLLTAVLSHQSSYFRVDGIVYFSTFGRLSPLAYMPFVANILTNPTFVGCSPNWVIVATGGGTSVALTRIAHQAFEHDLS
ncbi:hypothetical protein ACIBHX_24095 [Nonomuraea sp. NPDC050536]|uniref:hypothetical protein n=1 Tax=Nonomuraea sp. NPDC050536 TaxID=3364366 RepID=UPI0037C784EF